MSSKKLYIHYEGSPEFTMVIRWSENPKVTVENLLEQFSRAYNTRHGEKNALELEDLVIHTPKGNNLTLETEIETAVEDKMDLFVVPKSGPKDYRDEYKNLRWSEERYIVTTSMKQAEDFERRKDLKRAAKMYLKILRADKTHLKSLLGLYYIYMDAQRPVDALVYIQIAVDNYPFEKSNRFKLGKCLLEVGQSEEAHKVFLDYLEFLEAKYAKVKKGGLSLEWTSIRQDIHNVEAAIGKAFLKEGNKDVALQLFADILKEDKDHIDALVSYALLTAEKGKKFLQESVMVMLTVLAHHRRHDKKIQQNIAFLAQLPGAVDFFKIEMKSSWHNTAAVLYIAGLLRDFGATWEAMIFAKRAFQIDKGTNPGTALFMMHLNETLYNHSDAFKVGCQFFRENTQFKIAGFQCSKFLPLFNGIKDISYNQVIPKGEIDAESMDLDTRELTEDERQALGILFTLVKVLFLKGCLNLVRALVAPLEKMHSGRNLHFTNIRNEAAYFLCVYYVMTIPIQSLPEKPEFIYFFADSHCIAPAWRTVVYHGKTYVIHPLIATGLKVWHLRQESKFYPKSTFYNAVKQIPEGSKVIFNFGELDCREGVLYAVEKCKYDSLEEACATSVCEYVKVLKLLAIHKFRIFVHPVLPILTETRSVVQVFNKVLKDKMKAEGFKWMRFLDHLNLSDGTFNPDYSLDGTHVHPKYITLLEKALNEF